jgi:hypothetical protein
VSTRAFGCLVALLAVLASVSSLRAQTAESREAKAQTPASTQDLSGVWTRRGSPNQRYLGHGFSQDELPMPQTRIIARET